MLTLLSPAKKLNFSASDLKLDMTQPVLSTHTTQLAQTAKQQSPTDLKRLMHISDALAQLNAARFKNFDANNKANPQMQAILAFNGDVYGGLSARHLKLDELTYAQDHIRILSGLYGVLRPLDAIQPYRLEMGTRMKNSRGASLYDFWGVTIAQTLQADLATHTQAVVINLASNEYVKAVDKTVLNVPIINVRFLNVKDGHARSLMFYAKRARGLMARWIIQNRIDQVSALKEFKLENYAYETKASTATELVFSRPQPPKKD